MQSRGEGDAVPFKKDDVILRARSQAAWRPKDLVTPELFLGRRGACTEKVAEIIVIISIKYYVSSCYGRI